MGLDRDLDKPLEKEMENGRSLTEIEGNLWIEELDIRLMDSILSIY